MNCEIFRILYVRANGEVACNCGTGEKVNLGWLPEAPAAASSGRAGTVRAPASAEAQRSGQDEAPAPGPAPEDAAPWRVSALFANAQYTHMRHAFAADRLPWGEACRECVFLNRQEPFFDGLKTKRLDKVHLEPSLACALRCPGCSRIHQVKERKGSTFIAPARWERLLRSLAEEGYSIGYFYFCGQGEPCSHPQLEELIRLCRHYFPRTQLIVNTNGNYDFAQVFPTQAWPDKLIVSVDGLHQSSYVQYRINGQVDLALRFMEDAKRIAGSAVMVEWKYILFCYNDSDTELLAAQLRATSLGVDSILFVLTHTPEKSRRFTAANLDAFPLRFANASIETTLHLLASRPVLPAVTVADSDQCAEFAGRGRVRIVLDQLQYRRGWAFLKGWALGAEGENPRRLRVRFGGDTLVNAQLFQPRPDVALAHPEHGNYHAGFQVVCPVPASIESAATPVAVEYEAFDGSLHTFTVQYDFRPARPAAAAAVAPASV